MRRRPENSESSPKPPAPERAAMIGVVTDTAAPFSHNQDPQATSER